MARRGIRTKLRTNVDEALASLESNVRTATAVAVPRWLDTMRDRALVAGLREAVARYGIKRSDLLRFGTIEVDAASASDTESTIVVGGRTLPLYLFPHRQTARGVSVTIGEHVFEFPHAFMIKGRPNRVFARGVYTSGGGALFKPSGSSFWNLRFGRGRFPISILRTMSVHGMFARPSIVAAMVARCSEVADAELRRAFRSVFAR